MKNAITIIIALIVGVVCGSFGSEMFNEKDNKDAVSSAIVVNGVYDVDATWEWKKLEVKDSVWTLDDERIYNVSTTNDNIVILKGENLTSLVLYKVDQKDGKIEFRSFSKDGVGDEILATLTKE